MMNLSIAVSQSVDLVLFVCLIKYLSMCNMTGNHPSFYRLCSRLHKNTQFVYDYYTSTGSSIFKLIFIRLNERFPSIFPMNRFIVNG